MVCATCFLCTGLQASAQHWSFDGENPLKADKKNDVLELKNVRNQIELTAGVIGKGLRTDGYSTSLRTEIRPNQNVSACSGWFALESFPTDTAAFFALKDRRTGISISVGVNRFGEIVIGKGNGKDFSYLPTGHFVKKFSWLNIALGMGSADRGVWINGQKLKINMSLINFPAKAGEILIGKDFRENLLGQMDLTAINGIIDELRLWNKPLPIKELQNEIAVLAKKVPVLAIPAERFKDDFSRPKYHLMPAANWTNETHGLIFYKGRYHIFNQKNASNLALRQINWGHFSSPDLVNWTEHKPALSPERGYDENGIWSGHVILDDKGIPMISYTAGGPKMGIALAFPKDSTLNDWIKYKQNPVIPGQPDGYGRTDLRDTYVWKEGNKWYMVVGFGVKKDDVEKGALLLYSSPDLKNWNFLHTLFEGNPDLDNSGIFWEMPVFKKIGDKYVLLVNKVPHKGVPARALYWVGSFVNERFVPDNPMPKNLEVINRLLSPSVTEDKDGRICAIAIIPDEISGEAAYNQGWSHLYSLPRVWNLTDGTLNQSPHPALRSLRVANSNFFDATVANHQSVKLYSGHQQYEVVAQVRPNKSKQFGFVLHKNPDGSEYTKIYYDVDAKELVVDQRHSSTKKGIPLRIKKDAFALDTSKPVGFHVFVDGSVVEIFINDQHALTTRIFPSKEQSNQAEIFSEGDSIQIKAEVWAIRPAVINTDF
ncbi:glycoside hydrolase family 32 protein [Pedobacter hiemivivus]|uniref:beta-fructofuranosidase n=2 Tax=Pedobacter hiemivivus TaxID=2530454 RepID=A0A4U1GER3_9SPHI|nr:glycoside hydrolase family 32 protein [Pedobacter hiemivivus]